MAMLYKNAILSSEEVFLNPVHTANKMDESEIDAPLTVGINELEQAKKEAYDQGLLAGKAEERTQNERELAQLKKQLMETLASIPAAVAQNRLDLQSEIAEIVLLITQQFFIENQNNSVTLSQQINQILSQLNNRQSVELCLHPQDIEALQSGLIQLEASHLNSLKVKADDSLILGGCLVKTSHGTFDASIEKQIDKLKEVLLQIKQRGQHALVD